MFGRFVPDKVMPQLCADVTLLRVTFEFYAQNPWAYTPEMFENLKQTLWGTRLGLFELRNSFAAFEEQRQACFEKYWYFSYLLYPTVMLAPVAKWRAMLMIALRDIAAAQACLHDMVTPASRVA